MYSNDELTGLYQFLKSTGEGPLRKMLVEGKMTDTHMNLLLKVVRGCDESQFVEHFNNETFPKVKMNAGEMAIKELFWAPCRAAFTKVGLIQPVKAAA